MANTLSLDTGMAGLAAGYASELPICEEVSWVWDLLFNSDLNYRHIFHSGAWGMA